MASNIRELSNNSKSSVGSARENDEEIRTAIDNVNQAIKSFDATINSLITATGDAIQGVKLTSDNSQRIRKSMEELEQLAKEVEDMIVETNKVLQ